MTQAEKEKPMNDKWPVFSEKDEGRFLKFMNDASKAKIFDIDECEKCKRMTPC